MIPLLVLGIGNTLLSDDGLGPRAVEALALAGGLPEGARTLDGGTEGLLLLPAIEDAERLIVIDAIDRGAGVPAGEIARLVDDEVPAALSHAVSPHEVGLADMLALCHLRGTLPREVVLYAVQAARVAPGTALSPAVEAALPRVVAAVRDEARRMLQPF